MCYSTLPESYTLHDKIDLQHNKKQFWLVQALAFAIIVIMLVCGYFIDNFSSFDDGTVENIIGIVVVVVGVVLYIILHEATHGLFMHLFVKGKLNFGFKGWAAYAGSSGYFDKKHYIVISLAPLVLWGIVFAVLNIVFNHGVWFWVIWILQLCNISGASGDMFCTYKMLRYPKDILVYDSGMDMLIFRRKTDAELAAEKQEEASID